MGKIDWANNGLYLTETLLGMLSVISLTEVISMGANMWLPSRSGRMLVFAILFIVTIIVFLLLASRIRSKSICDAGINALAR